MLHSPEEQDVYGKTLEEALALCLVWLRAPEIGIGPFLVRAAAAALLRDGTGVDAAQVAAHERGDAVVVNAIAPGVFCGRPTVCQWQDPLPASVKVFPATGTKLQS